MQAERKKSSGPWAFLILLVLSGALLWWLLRPNPTPPPPIPSLAPTEIIALPPSFTPSPSPSISPSPSPSPSISPSPSPPAASPSPPPTDFPPSPLPATASPLPALPPLPGVLVEVAVSEAIYGGIIPATYGRFGGLYANPELIAAGHVMISVPAGGGLPAFFIDTFEVSNAQMLTYISGLGPEFDPAWIARGAGPLDQNRAGDWALRDSQAVFWPVHGVSGLAARAYCANIGAALPTWEQWSRAAFWAGDDLPPRPYPWGEAVPDRSLAHFNAEGPLPRQSLEGGRSWAGAYHLAGNVAEWVTLADGSLAVVGGSFLQDAVGLQASLAEPQAQDPGQAIRGVGFRCAQN